MSLVVNFFGGPGISKSTMSAHLFAELKWLGINSELVTEYAKEKVWEGSFDMLKDQRNIYGKQYHMLWRAEKNVDVVITDSPILLSAVYCDTNDKRFIQLVVEDFKKFKNVNFLLNRKKEYVQSGRLQEKEESEALDFSIRKCLVDNGIEFYELDGVRDSVPLALQKVLEFISSEKRKDGSGREKGKK